MSSKTPSAANGGLKLNYKRTFIIGFAFFGILLFWQIYDSWCPTFLSELFAKTFNKDVKDVQYLVGVMMALDNLAALILLPIFGKLSDKTNTKIGKRMPYILVGTFVCAVAFPFIPVLVHANATWGVIALMAIVLIFAMMYRNPAVALMPDVTPKPLRSKANGIINIMGYIGGAFAAVIGIFFAVSDYYGKGNKGTTWATGNIWAIEVPFLMGSVLMLVSALVLFFLVKENKIADEMKDEMARGEALCESPDSVSDDKPLSKENRKMLWLILIAEFFWFMADNGVSTFMVNYTIYHLGVSSGTSLINTIVMGVGSVIGFALGGIISERIGRKWTLWSGLALTVACYALWAILSFAVPATGKFPVWLFVIFFVKGFGMSLVHVNSFPMVVELCSSKKVGAFTGYYYASSMAAQTITPCLLGLLLLVPSFNWTVLPIYATACMVVSAVVFFFVKNVKVGHLGVKKGLEAFDQDE